MIKSFRPGALLIAIAFGFFAFDAAAQSSQPAAPQPGHSSRTIVAAGSGVNLGITRLLAEAFMATHPGVKIEVPGSIGSKGAIKAIADHAITIGLVSKPIKDEEKVPGSTSVAYARTPIVIGANSTVSEDDISSQDLVAVYKGTKTKWRDGHEIIVQSREAFDSGFQVLEKAIPGFKEAVDESRKTERWSVNFTDQDANKALAVVRYAIGVTDLGMISTEHLSIKPLKLDGIAPSIENLQSGRYSLGRTLYLYYHDKDLSPEAKAFVDFIRSEEGAKLLRDHGYLPLAFSPAP